MFDISVFFVFPEKKHSIIFKMGARVRNKLILPIPLDNKRDWKTRQILHIQGPNKII